MSAASVIAWPRRGRSKDASVCAATVVRLDARGNREHEFSTAGTVPGRIRGDTKKNEINENDTK